MQFALHARRLARTAGTDGWHGRHQDAEDHIVRGIAVKQAFGQEADEEAGPVPHTPEADLHRCRQLTRGCLTHVDHEIRHRGRYEPGRSVRLGAIDSGFHGVPAGPGPDSAQALRLTGTYG